MSKTLASVTLLLIVLLSSACSVHTTMPEAEAMQLVFEPATLEHCTSRGEVVGSAGSWYDFWLVSNKNWSQAAIADMRNDAHAMGANTLLFRQYLDFATSVTFLAEAYSCP